MLLLALAIVTAAIHTPLAKGQTIGFTCEPRHERFGLQCRGWIDPSVYPEEILVVLPATLKWRTESELIVHFHGHRRTGETFDDVLGEFKFPEMLAETGREAVLVVPSSQGRCKTFKDVFGVQKGFKPFVAALARQLYRQKLIKGDAFGRLVISGHSGAHAPVAALIAQDAAQEITINELYLFDAAYESLLTLASFAAKASAIHDEPRPRFAIAYTASTAVGMNKIWELLPTEVKTALCARYSVDTPSCNLASIAQPTDVATASESLAFVRADVGHWRTVNKYFPVFLKAPR